MKVFCRTNLDLAGEEWPYELPEVPRVGDHIQSKTEHGKFQLELRVCRVTWKWVKSWEDEREGIWRPEIELHMTYFHENLTTKEGNCRGSFIAFYEWYAPLVGRHVSSFI